jgi:hypothetical protein
MEPLLLKGAPTPLLLTGPKVPPQIDMAALQQALAQAIQPIVEALQQAWQAMVEIFKPVCQWIQDLFKRLRFPLKSLATHVRGSQAKLVNGRYQLIATSREIHSKRRTRKSAKRRGHARMSYADTIRRMEPVAFYSL